ncbi:hypothetical protein SCLCIDRAFT_778716 [Scleroderma citrinum Foug A]|uniref:Uncharacterized protein n=1 Tax=Scleroderma citrinum Foug A TaxID=1036808 RepID=A0A0C3E490_9AGAM|nr:hypothetical protein SCLCIDRAFT_778716 [Scleroderma citrinum Foug A]
MMHECMIDARYTHDRSRVTVTALALGIGAAHNGLPWPVPSTQRSPYPVSCNSVFPMQLVTRKGRTLKRFDSERRGVPRSGLQGRTAAVAPHSVISHQ